METVVYESGKIKARLGRTVKTLVNGVKFSVGSGRTLGIIGESGSGKTMIACSVMKLLPKNVSACGMKFLFCGDDLSDAKSLKKLLGDKIVYIPQSGHECLNPSRKVRFQMFDALAKIGVKKSEREKEAMKNLARAGFADAQSVMEKYPFELSGGMAGRVAAAIGLCSNARFVIADEPVSGIEDKLRHEFVGLIKKVFPYAAKLIITHDISVARMCDEIIVMCGGRVMERGTAESVLSNPRSPYTRALLDSLPENGMRRVPKIRGVHDGCPFYPRCVAADIDCLCAGECLNV